MEVTSNGDNKHEKSWVWSLFLAMEMRVVDVPLFVWWLTTME